MSDTLSPGNSLSVNGSLTSQDGRFTLILQADGNLVLYRSGGSARWATGTNGRQVTSAIMQTDGNFVVYGPGGLVVFATATNGHPGAYLIVQNDGNVVIYLGGKALWATGTNIVSVPGFLPSTSGFHFSNSFPSVPDLTINVLGANITIGDASNGLCGGMVFAVRDYFQAGIPIPPPTMSPSSGPLFDYMVKRLLDSFNLTKNPPGPATYMTLMDPALPDHNTTVGPHGRAWIMIKEQWPLIKADLDGGKLSPMGLIEIKSTDPTMMGHNHQVLAYQYDLNGSDLTLSIYDCNMPDDDTITLSLSLANPQATTPVTNTSGDPVWCFFRPDYTFSAPPPPDGMLYRETTGTIWILYGGAKFHVPDMPTLNRLYPGRPVNQLTGGGLDTVPTAPVDGTLLREENGTISIVYGGAKFHVPDMPTLTRLYGGRPVDQLWDGALNGISTIPNDGTLLREENGTIWIVYGGAKFHVPDMPTLARLYGGRPVDQLWTGAVGGFPAIPQDGTLLREESSTQVFRITNGRKVAIPTPATGTVLILWNGGLSQIP